MLFRRLHGLPHRVASRYIHRPGLNGLTILGNYTTALRASRISFAEIAQAILDPGVLKAVIVRDPVTRLLSAYIDRCVEQREWNRCGTRRGANLSAVVGHFERLGPSFLRSADLHFRPQATQCGLRWVRFDIEARFESYAESARTILERVNLRGRVDAVFGSAAGIARTSNHRHSQHGTEGRVCAYYSPQLLQRVRALYRVDYERFGFDTATWHARCGFAVTRAAGT